VTLVFDRAVAIGGINVGAVLVNDEFTNETYAGSGAVLVAPDTVQLSLTPVGAASWTNVVLDAAANNGIVAVNDGGTWPGANSLLLPFP
jgi:hypothetical protein